MRICYMTHVVAFAVKRQGEDWDCRRPIPFKPLEYVRLTLYPPRGCTLGLEVYDDTLYVYRPADVPPTDLDRERWKWLTSEPFLQGAVL